MQVDTVSSSFGLRPSSASSGKALHDCSIHPCPRWNPSCIKKAVDAQEHLPCFAICIFCTFRASVVSAFIYKAARQVALPEPAWGSGARHPLYRRRLPLCGPGFKGIGAAREPGKPKDLRIKSKRAVLKPRVLKYTRGQPHVCNCRKIKIC